ncbi:MAG: hypothetical protein CFE29_03670 [Bradyrhizobiaceae bacterium PARB1]|jgi:transcriptional regulator GlxA family with amidase domain|nr:MAG: hypothetical protein CFE29_03670 [Bradyrhizobiaceae bacterium PARB1]
MPLSVRLSIERDAELSSSIRLLVKEVGGNVIGELRFSQEYKADVKRIRSPQPKPLDCATLDLIILYLEKNLAGAIQVDRLASECRISEYHFFRRFKATFGVSPYSLVTSIRLIWAKHLIATTSLSVPDVSSLVGILNASYFRRQFRRLHNKSPADVRLLKKRVTDAFELSVSVRSGMQESQELSCSKSSR